MSVYMPTPILDRKAPLPGPAPARTATSVWGLLGLFVVLTFVFVPVVFLLLPLVLSGWTELLRRSFSIGTVLGGVPLVLAAYLAAIAIHELGHLLGGLAAGFRYHSLRIGPFQFDSRLALTLDRKFGSLYTGMVVMVPVTVRGLVRRGFAMVGAGPLANLLTGCLVYALPFPKGVFGTAFIAWSILIGLAELIPLRSAIGWSDGKVLGNCLRRPAWSARWFALMQLRVDFVSQTPPEALSPEFLDQAVAIRDASLETLAAHGFAYTNAFHRQQTERAAQMLEVCLEHIGHAPAEVREALIGDAAMFHAEKRRNPELARQWLESLRSTSRRWDVLRVEAVILHAEGDSAGVLAKLNECEAEAHALPEGPERTWLLDAIEQWRARLGPA